VFPAEHTIAYNLEYGYMTLDDVKHTKAYAIAEKQLADAQSKVETSTGKKEESESH
jgi:hypothetical protein